MPTCEQAQGFGLCEVSVNTAALDPAVIKEVLATCPNTCNTDIDLSGHPAFFPLAILHDYKLPMTGVVRDVICSACAKHPDLPCCHNHPHNQTRGRSLAQVCADTLEKHKVLEVDTTRPGAQAPWRPGGCTYAVQDPHLHFAHGGRADFRGKHGQYYSFFSAPGLAVNLKPEDATFELRRNDGATLTVEGSFITEAHVVARVGPPDRPAWANFSFWASELTENNWGYKVINGTCDGRRVRIGKGKSKRCEELTVSVHMSTASFEAGNWTVTVKASPVYNLIAGPEHRLDIGFRVKGDYAARFLPHGIFGQSFSSTEPRHGKVDAYPHSGHFRTTAMAEGAIEGEAAQYEVGSPYATRFVYSRFETTPQQGDWPQHVMLAGDQDGSVGRRRRRRQRIRV